MDPKDLAFVKGVLAAARAKKAATEGGTDGKKGSDSTGELVQERTPAGIESTGISTRSLSLGDAADPNKRGNPDQKKKRPYLGPEL